MKNTYNPSYKKGLIVSHKGLVAKGIGLEISSLKLLQLTMVQVQYN
jgi:hypothetical protein